MLTDEFTLETTGQDWANHLSHTVSGNGTICLAALLSQAPNMDLLRRAAADLADRQPVLRCRFDDAQSPPVWVPAGDAATVKEFRADTLRDGLNAFLRDDPTKDAAMKIALVTTPKETALCLALDHAATDGGGAKRCLGLLCECYQARLTGEIAAGKVSEDRSDARIYARCGLADYRIALKREAPAPGALATVPFDTTDGRRLEYRWIDIPLAAVRRAGGTVNDRLIAAFASALAARRAGDERLEIHMTVDLRRYLDEGSAPAAANLSGMETVVAEIAPGQSFAETVADVQKKTAAIKNDRPGVAGAAMMTYMRTMPYAKARAFLTGAGEKSRTSGVAAPLLSNLGLIALGALAFGDAAVTGVVPLLPAMRAPAFMLGACGYGDRLTISTGFYAEERSARDVEGLLKDIGDCLIRQ